MKHFDITLSLQPFELDLDNLLHPAQAFAHPRDVVADADLTVNEKRAVLASWASDACAVEAVPALRHPPGAAAVVSVDEILQALRSVISHPTRQRSRRSGYADSSVSRGSGF
jgi:hypothetical protein